MPEWIDRYIPKRDRVMQASVLVTLAITGSHAISRPTEVSLLVVGRLPPACYEPAA